MAAARMRSSHRTSSRLAVRFSKAAETRESTCKGPKAATAGKAVLAYGNTLEITQARAPPLQQLPAPRGKARDSAKA